MIFSLSVEENPGFVEVMAEGLPGLS